MDYNKKANEALEKMMKATTKEQYEYFNNQYKFFVSKI